MNLAIDLDGTLAEWLKDTGDAGGGPGGGYGVGQWVEGAREALGALLEAGHEVTVHTCRATWPEGGGWQAVAHFLVSGGFRPALVGRGPRVEVKLWPRRSNGPTGGVGYPSITVDEHAFAPGHLAPVVGIWVGKGKPIAHAYIDDRAIPFTGSWASVLDALGLARQPTELNSS